MAVQILSDLHLEAPKAYDHFKITPTADHLALLGDIGNVVSHRVEFLEFLQVQLRQFSTVLFVPGNHEAYHSSWPKALETLRKFEADVQKRNHMGNFILMDRNIFRPSGTKTVILGCSLFSFVPPDQEKAVDVALNDFSSTTGWTVTAHNAAHRKDLAWLNEEVQALQDSDVEIIIMTHWSPTTDDRSIDPRFRTSSISTAFSTDLSQEPCFASMKVKTWAFGHTHYNCDFVLDREGGAGPLRLLANQRGNYFAQAKGFNGEKVIVL